MRVKSSKIGFLSRLQLKIVFIIDFLNFVPPSLKGKGDRGKGPIARNPPTITTRIRFPSLLKIIVDNRRSIGYNCKRNAK